MLQAGVVSSSSTRLCWICSRSVSSGSIQTDEHGSTVHLECHMARLKLKEAEELQQQSHELSKSVNRLRRVATAECKRCASHDLQSFSGELAIHFPGWDGLTKPLVFVFPRLEVCLGCGSTNFSIPEEQLNFLRRDLAVSAGAGDALRR